MRTVPALTSSVALNRLAVVLVPLAPICSINRGLFVVPADVRKSGNRKPTKEGLLIVKVTGFVSVQLPLNCTVSITGYTPIAVGVPEIVGCDAFGMDKPGGNPVAL